MNIEKPRGTLIHEWDQDKENRYRLVSVGKWSRGYEDGYQIEKLSVDSLGEPRWDSVFAFKSDSEGAFLLVGALKSILLAERTKS